MTETFIAVAIGVLSWSLAEYTIHRFAGHGHRANRNLFGKEHTAHHSRPDYFAPWWKKAAAAIIVTAVLIGPVLLVVGRGVGLGFIGGFVGFYLLYELFHRLEPIWAGLGPYGKWARRHHFYHHFHDPRCNHGVTSPLWDIVFGTYKRVEMVQVPSKLAMRWLCDGETGAVHERFRKRYQLRGRPEPRAQADNRPVKASAASTPSENARQSEHALDRTGRSTSP